MTMVDSGESPDKILGEEFLTWLWYASDTAPDSFVDTAGQSFSVYMEQRIVVQGGEGQGKETASVSGCLSALQEARVGLATGKKVIRALLRIEINGLTFQFVLKSADFCLGSLKTPKIEKDNDDEPDALLLEKIYLVETCLKLIDNLYDRFLKLRFSAKWDEEANNISQWLGIASNL